MGSFDHDEASNGRAREPTNDFARNLLVALTNGPCTVAEIEAAVRGFGRRLPGDPRGQIGGRRAGREMRGALVESLDAAIRAGWVHREVDRYALTEQGRDVAAQVERTALARRERIHHWIEPSTVAKTTLMAQLAITAVKVPAALLSGSIAQANDAVEEVLDVIGSAIVFLGIRTGREREATVVLVVLVLATGVAAVAVALQRLVHPAAVSLGWFPLTIAVVSIPFYVVRSTYERTAGLRSRSVALVTQSVDSRNHAVVAATVVLGLSSNALHVPRIDALVGAGVAILIVKTGIVLASDTIRAARTGTEPVLERYSLWVTDRFDIMISNRIQIWLLYVVADEHLTDRNALLARIQPALDEHLNPLVATFGRDADTPTRAEPILDALIERGWLAGTDTLHITKTGARYLHRWQRRRY